MTMKGSDRTAQDTQSYLLSELIGRKVSASGQPLGSLGDFVIVDKDKVAEVTHICVDRPFGRTRLFVPWAQVREFQGQEIKVDAAEAEIYAAPLPGSPIYLKDFILDKKILDVAEREVEVVYDIRLVLRNRLLFVTDVEISRFALLRRLGLGWLARLLYRAEPSADSATEERRLRERTVPWSYVEALPENIGIFKGELHLKVLKDQLANIPPVDVADILEELSHAQAVAVFQELDTEHASDTLEELNPKFQRDMIASIKKEKAAQLINEMTPGQAADLLAVLPLAEAQALLKLIDHENAAKIRSILSEQEAKIADFTDTEFLRFAPETTVAQARAVLQRTAKEHNRDAVMYMYVLDAGDKLLGVVALRDLLLADDAMELRNIMQPDAIAINPDNTMRDAAGMFKRYGFRAIPVLDAAGKMLGILPYRDVASLRQRDLG